MQEIFRRRALVRDSSESVLYQSNLTLPQVLLLLTVVLPRRRVDSYTVVAVLGYRITHNRSAYKSHRRRRLKMLARLVVPGLNTDVSL